MFKELKSSSRLSNKERYSDTLRDYIAAFRISERIQESLSEEDFNLPDMEDIAGRVFSLALSATTDINLSSETKRRMGDFCVLQEKPESAISYYEEALEHITKTDFLHKWSLIQTKLGECHRIMDTGDRSNARRQKAIEFSKSATERLPYERFPHEWADASYQLGLAYIENGQAEKGIDQLQKSLHISTPESRPRECLNVGKAIGETAYQRKDWRTAIEGFLPAVEAVEVIRSGSNLHAERSLYVQENLSLYTSLVESYIQNRNYTHAFEQSEKLKSRQLVELIKIGALNKGKADKKGEYKAFQMMFDDAQRLNDQTVLQRQERAAAYALHNMMVGALNPQNQRAFAEKAKEFALDQMHRLDLEEFIDKHKQISYPSLQDITDIIDTPLYCCS